MKTEEASLSDDSESEEQKNHFASRFIDDIADVAEKDDEEDDFVEDDDAELNEAQANEMRDEIQESRKNHQQLYDLTKRELVTDKEMEYVQELEQRASHGQDYDLKAEAQSQMLPTNKDPFLFQVKCKQGCEREAVIQLMNKYLALKGTKQCLSILSATVSDPLKSTLYCEAYKEMHVRDAIKGIATIFQRQVLKVPKEEAPGVYQVDKASSMQLKQNEWVRIGMPGLYKDDYAKVVDHDPESKAVWVRIVPRLDVQTKDPAARQKKKGQSDFRPPAKFFNYNEHRDAKENMQRDPRFGMHMWSWNRMKFKHGFLYKKFSAKHIITDIIPPIEIVQKFTSPSGAGFDDQDDANFEDHEKEMERLEQLHMTQTQLSRGDKVIVNNGELKNLTGVVVQVKGKDLIVFKPDSKEIPHNLELPTTDLSKHFALGNHVAVISGRHKGERGHVTKIEGVHSYFFSDSARREYRVFTNDLKLSSQVAAQNIEHAYIVNDLVQFGTRVGIVIGIDRDFVRVINDQNMTQNIKVTDIQQKIVSKRGQQSWDRERRFVTQQDVVKVIEGPNRGKRGTIVHIYKDVLFLYNREMRETQFIFVEKSTSVALLGADYLPSGRATMNTKVRDDEWVGQEITICKGEYKGQSGHCKQVKGERVRIVLKNKSKIVEQLKSECQLTKDNATDTEASRGFEIQTPAYVPQSPGMNSVYQTPNYDGGASEYGNAWKPGSVHSPKNEDFSN